MLLEGKFIKWFELCALCLLACMGCNQQTPQPAKDLGFYYWKTEPMDSAFVHPLKEYGVQMMYTKVMDIDWNEQKKEALPITRKANLEASLRQIGRVIPVVFITNKAMLQIDSNAAIILANNIARSILDWQQKNEVSIEELQIDCDWTAKSKHNYFIMLSALKQAIPQVALSVTLRLYPYKYPQHMGVPPVDKAMLMCYNMGTIKDSATDNSIFSLATLQSYLVSKKYPIKLDIALPVFGWYVWFRNDEYQGIIYEPEWKLIAAKTKALGRERYQLTEEVNTLQNFYRAGDILRNEYPSNKDILASVGILEQYIPNFERLVYYHLTMENIEKYEQVFLEQSAKH